VGASRVVCAVSDGLELLLVLGFGLCWQVPAINACIDDATQEIVYKDYCDVSVAVASPKGLVVPVLRNTHTMSFKVGTVASGAFLMPLLRLPKCRPTAMSPVAPRLLAVAWGVA
jgi:hypothetical protein